LYLHFTGLHFIHPGIYEQKKQLINVNRGFGVLAYPGRIGIWPEITVIELKKGSKPA
jgi:hypothetical protein